ncbi:hypothetical protein EDB86DRAFT_2826432 [Lactarius hatsudake]|nr:hypothetical protein EDB86DRAFT_2826432 [Lactarius hatsudake]
MAMFFLQGCLMVLAAILTFSVWRISQACCLFQTMTGVSSHGMLLILGEIVRLTPNEDKDHLLYRAFDLDISTVDFIHYSDAKHRRDVLAPFFSRTSILQAQDLVMERAVLPIITIRKYSGTLVKIIHRIPMWFGQNFGSPVTRALFSLHKTTVIKEGFRMFPGSAALPRVVPPEGATIAGTFIPGGVLDAADSDTFVPERWLGEDAKTHEASLVPFSKDRRTEAAPNLVGVRRPRRKNIFAQEVWPGGMRKRDGARTPFAPTCTQTRGLATERP